MNPAFAARMAAGIGVPIVMALLARLFPAREALETGGPSLDDLRPHYGKWDTGLRFMFLALCVPITLVLWSALRRLSWWHATLLPPAEITLTAMPEYWLLVAMFLSMLCADPLLSGIARLLLGDRYRRFKRYQALKYGFDEKKVAAVFLTPFAIALGAAIFLGLNWYVQVTASEVIVNPLLHVAERHPITEIRAISTSPRFVAPNGDVVTRREYVVTFSRGHALKTCALPVELTDAEKRTLMDRLSAKSGVPIREIAVFPKGEI